MPRFCQQITGAITTSRLEGLTSGLRITHTAVPLNARHSRCPRRIGADGGTRTNILRQPLGYPALPTELRLHEGVGARLSEPPDTMLLYFELSYEAVMSSTNSQSGDGAPPRFTANTPISVG